MSVRWLCFAYTIATVAACGMPHALIAAETPADHLNLSTHSDGSPGCSISWDRDSPLSLSRAADLALCNNAQIRVAWAIIREQAAALGEAKSAYWPTVSVAAGELKENVGYPGSRVAGSSESDYTVYGSLDWRLFDFGARSAGRRAAQATLDAAIASRDSVIEKTLGAVISAYFGCMTAQAVIADKTANESTARDIFISTQRRELQGRGEQNDTLQAANAVARTTLDKNRARGDFDKAVALLVYLLGLSPGSPIRLPQDVGGGGDTRADEQDLRAWLAETELHHPAITAARAALDAAQAQVVAARASGRPTLDFTANYYQNAYPYQGLTNTNTRQSTIGLSVTIPIFDGFATHYKVAAADATVKQREAELEDSVQSTLMGVVNAYADAESSLRNLRSSEDLLQAAEAAFSSSQRRYEHGVAEINELLTTRTALADAMVERLRCLSEWRTARLSLMASAGKLSRTDIKE
jgi:outer membrane protein